MNRGLVGSFDSIARIYDENDAIMHSSKEYYIEETSDEIPNVSFLELQLLSIDIARQLYHRFGVRSYDNIVLICKSNAIAEIVAMLACIRLGAPFVPIDDTWLVENPKKFTDIIYDSKPVAAILVGENDMDLVAVRLSQLNVHRCLYLHSDGSMIVDEGNTGDIRDDIPVLYDYGDSDDDDEIEEVDEVKEVVQLEKKVVERNDQNCSEKEIEKMDVIDIDHSSKDDSIMGSNEDTICMHQSPRKRSSNMGRCKSLSPRSRASFPTRPANRSCSTNR